MCPITSQVKGYPFEVALISGSVHGVVLSDHLKNLDWKERKAVYKGKVSPETLQAVVDKVSSLLQLG